MMKRALLHIVYCLLTVGFISCHESDHNIERGLAAALSLAQTENVNDVTLWAFDTNGVLQQKHTYTSPKDVASTLIDIPAGKYTLVAASNLTGNFTYNATKGTIRIEELLITINDASSSPAHSHYGMATVDVADSGISYANVSLFRSMSELSFTIASVPAEVVSAKLEVINSAKGYNPGIGKLHSEAAVVDYGLATPTNGKLIFGTKRLMPTTASGNRSKAMLRLTINYNNGTLIFNIETPALQNGGVYTPEIVYSAIKPGIVLEVTHINGWVELPPINGEILNPIN